QQHRRRDPQGGSRSAARDLHDPDLDRARNRRRDVLQLSLGFGRARRQRSGRAAEQRRQPICPSMSFDVDRAPALPPPERRIYANRTLNLRSIRALGFDMDYTLVHYKVREWELRAYEHARSRLLEQGFPDRKSVV